MELSSLTLKALADYLNLELVGDDKPFTGLNTLEKANSNEVSFLANPKYLSALSSTKAGAVIVSKEYANLVNCALISENPYQDFALAASLFVKKQGVFEGISELAFIDPSAVIGPNCTIYPYAYVSANAYVGSGSTIYPGAYIGLNSKIGEECVLFPNSVIMADVVIGDRCVLQSGSVVGTDGFGFIRFAGDVHKIPQIGSVVLNNDVEVGANSCIDRATLGDTFIGSSSKIDNLVQIGHNVEIDEQCLLISQVGIAGSTKIGKRATLAGQAGIAGHLNIGDDVIIGPQAGVAKDIPSNVAGSGSPFMERSNYLRSSILVSKLPELLSRIKELEKQVSKLQEIK